MLRRYYGEKSEVWNMSKDTTPKISRETVPQYFSRGWICVSRGWDSIAIEKFLPIPDRVMPHSGGAADVLYRRDRVKEIEDSSKEFCTTEVTGVFSEISETTPFS